jgi:predicted negative regulator of RcsB-dependent stress response
MKIFVNVVLIAIISIFGWQFFNLYSQYSSLKKTSFELNAGITTLKSENSNISSDIQYFSNPENLEKELKSKTNYKKPGENMIIVVPSKDQSSAQ